MIQTHEKIRNLASNGSSAEELWLLFKTKLNQSVTNHIPHKIAKQKDSLPWLTPNVRKLIRRRDRLYKRKKKSADPKITSKFKEARQKVQKELRRAYWKYIENIVTPKEETQPHSNMKRFWTYIKHMKTDSSGVAPLRSDGVLHSHPVDQATILNKQFQSAFSSKETYSPEEFKSRCNMPERQRKPSLQERREIQGRELSSKSYYESCRSPQHSISITTWIS
ncbi:Hypothetical predicted protein [Mytilus galloprovincialis]|uniref:Uncharacterized protein n=1 Tax=Mytilus galloprovincialis TaxID=29158 RepID=A0A8B6EMX5_MYTGA|nr:Hypothetical predicted protein [Mytilus galloprovincialis]